MQNKGSACVNQSFIPQRTTLKSGDADIECLGLNELVPQPRFSAEKYCSLLRSRTLGQNLLVAACIPSTQTLLHQHFTKLPDGVLCVADTQTSGKGDSSQGRSPFTGSIRPCVCRKESPCIDTDQLENAFRPRIQYVDFSCGLSHVFGIHLSQYFRYMAR